MSRMWLHYVSRFDSWIGVKYISRNIWGDRSYCQQHKVFEEIHFFCFLVYGSMNFSEVGGRYMQLKAMLFLLKFLWNILCLQFLSFLTIAGPDLEPFILFRSIEVLHSAYTAGHVKITDYISFIVTLLSRYKVFPGTLEIILLWQIYFCLLFPEQHLVLDSLFQLSFIYILIICFFIYLQVDIKSFRLACFTSLFWWQTH